MGQHESIVGGFLGGFLEEGPQVEARTAARDERERVAGIQEIQTQLAQRASITSQIGMEQKLADVGFNELAAGEAPGTSFTGIGPAQVIEVGGQRFARTSTPLSIQEAQARAASTAAGKIDPAVVGKAIVLLSNVAAQGGSIASASQVVEEEFGPAVLNAPGFRSIFTALSNQQLVGERQERGIGVQAGRDRRAEAFAVARKDVDTLQDLRAQATTMLDEIVNRRLRSIPTIEVVTATGRKVRLDSIRGEGGLLEFLEQSSNPKVNEQVIKALMENFAGGPAQLQKLLDSEAAINFEGR